MKKQSTPWDQLGVDVGSYRTWIGYHFGRDEVVEHSNKPRRENHMVWWVQKSKKLLNGSIHKLFQNKSIIKKELKTIF